MKKIAVFTGTRAEYGLLSPLMRSLQEQPGVCLQVIVSGMHLAPQFGETWRVIESDGFAIDAKVEMLLASDSACGVAKSIGVGVLGFADALERLQPECLVILGDRYEALAIAQVAVVMRIPVAHIHGGEITEGAYDDSIRHAISKLSHFHFVASDEYRRRVIQLGEAPSKVWNVGALGIENIKTVPRLTLEQLNQEFGFELNRPFVLVTYHPVTAGNEDSDETFGNLLQALDQFPEIQVLITYPNSDNGGGRLIQCLEEYAEGRPGRVFTTPSLGLKGYLSAVSQCEVVIGNSSSGIIEVPSLDKPTVNIGVRQKGRLSAASVIHTDDSLENILEGIQLALTPKFKKLSIAALNPYGSGNTTQEIVGTLLAAGKQQAKVFFDLPVEN
jgi:UDP-N-acetylglucosamine 2-epimerase (non-hydrolysing)